MTVKAGACQKHSWKNPHLQCPDCIDEERDYWDELDRFAMAALPTAGQAAIAQAKALCVPIKAEVIADGAYEIARAMIARREKERAK